MRKQIIGMLAGITLLAMGTAVGSAADTVVSQPVQSAQPSASPTQTASPDSTQKPLFIGNTTKIADKAYTGRKDLRVVVIESGVTEIEQGHLMDAPTWDWYLFQSQWPKWERKHLTAVQILWC